MTDFVHPAGTSVTSDKWEKIENAASHYGQWTHFLQSLVTQFLVKYPQISHLSWDQLVIMKYLVGFVFNAIQFEVNSE